ncbi:MAG TPA: DUF4230 domain-containing protein [Chthoniobacterales bacterium]
MKTSKRSSVFLCLVVAVLVVAALFIGDFLQTLPSRFVDESSHRLQFQAQKLRDQFFAVTNFQPVVRIKNDVVFEKSAQVAELAVVSRPTEVTREFVHTWAGSTKKLRLRGIFQVRGGFDLREKFEIVVGQGKPKILLPRARILSVEQTDLQVEAFQNGFWNAISASDIQSQTAALRDLARQQSGQVATEAEENLRSRLKTILGRDVEIIIESSPPPAL